MARREKFGSVLIGLVAAIGIGAALVAVIPRRAPAPATHQLGFPAQWGGGTSGGGSGTVTSVGGTAPISVSNGTTTPVITTSSAALSVLGNATNATAADQDITASSDNTVLRRSGTAIGFGSIPESTVTGLTTDLANLVPLSRTLTGTAPITIAGDNAAHDLSANRTIAIVAATASVAGSQAANDKSFDDSRSWARAQWVVAKGLVPALSNCRELPLIFNGINTALVPTGSDGLIDGGGITNGSGATLYHLSETTTSAVKTHAYAIFFRGKFQAPTSGKITQAGLVDAANAHPVSWAARFSASTTKFVFRNEAADLASSLNADASLHDFLIASDGTTTTGEIDSATVAASFANSVLTDEARGPFMFGTDVGAVTLQYFWVCW